LYAFCLKGRGDVTDVTMRWRLTEAVKAGPPGAPARTQAGT